MTKEHSYYVLAFYHLKPIEDPLAEISAHKIFFKSKNITSRIYISETGINGQMSGVKEDAEAYMNWMHSRPQFEDIHFKIHLYHENVFPRVIVKYRKKLVGCDQEIDFSKRGEHVSPNKWKEMLNNKDEHVLLDIRNEYEWQLGRFEGAELPPCETFREFEQYADQLQTSVDPKKTPVMMYCTGGIRCELFSSILIEKGFEKVYQLDGGIINYGLKEGSDHWLGKLFVFDDRLAVPISEEQTKVIGSCHHCQIPNDQYYNCANVDCNTLFLCCPECLKKFSGCCQEACTHSKRLRLYQHQNPHKPFKKKHHYPEIKQELAKT